MTLPQHISGLAEIADRYDGYIFDLWGVLHDGAQAYPGAVAALDGLEALGKKVAILSNAPRRAASVAERNTAMGLPGRYEGLVISSGEASWQHLASRPDPWHQALGPRCLHVGPERDLGMRAGLDYDFVEGTDQADFILLTGVRDNADGLDTYLDLLKAARARDLPLVCANPDLIVMRGAAMELCAGSIAQAYEDMGGQVKWHGKPFAEIYQPCFHMLGDLRKDRILAIGDSLRTDVAGAQGVGIDSLFVYLGIHAEEWLAGGANRVLDPKKPMPTWTIERLSWD